MVGPTEVNEINFNLKGGNKSSYESFVDQLQKNDNSKLESIIDKAINEVFDSSEDYYFNEINLDLGQIKIKNIEDFFSKLYNKLILTLEEHKKKPINSQKSPKALLNFYTAKGVYPWWIKDNNEFNKYISEAFNINILENEFDFKSILNKNNFLRLFNVLDKKNSNYFLKIILKEKFRSFNNILNEFVKIEKTHQHNNILKYDIVNLLINDSARFKGVSNLNQLIEYENLINTSINEQNLLRLDKDENDSKPFKVNINDLVLYISKGQIDIRLNFSKNQLSNFISNYLKTNSEDFYYLLRREAVFDDKQKIFRLIHLLDTSNIESLFNLKYDIETSKFISLILIVAGNEISHHKIQLNVLGVEYFFRKNIHFYSEINFIDTVIKDFLKKLKIDYWKSILNVHYLSNTLNINNKFSNVLDEYVKSERHFLISDYNKNYENYFLLRNTFVDSLNYKEQNYFNLTFNVIQSLKLNISSSHLKVIKLNLIEILVNKDELEILNFLKQLGEKNNVSYYEIIFQFFLEIDKWNKIISFKLWKNLVNEFNKFKINFEPKQKKALIKIIHKTHNYRLYYNLKKIDALELYGTSQNIKIQKEHLEELIEKELLPKKSINIIDIFEVGLTYQLQIDNVLVEIFKAIKANKIVPSKTLIKEIVEEVKKLESNLETSEFKKLIKIIKTLKIKGFEDILNNSRINKTDKNTKKSYINSVPKQSIRKHLKILLNFLNIDYDDEMIKKFFIKNGNEEINEEFKIYSYEKLINDLTSSMKLNKFQLLKASIKIFLKKKQLKPVDKQIINIDFELLFNESVLKNSTVKELNDFFETCFKNNENEFLSNLLKFRWINSSFSSIQKLYEKNYKLLITNFSKQYGIQYYSTVNELIFLLPSFQKKKFSALIKYEALKILEDKVLIPSLFFEQLSNFIAKNLILEKSIDLNQIKFEKSHSLTTLITRKKLINQESNKKDYKNELININGKENKNTQVRLPKSKEESFLDKNSKEINIRPSNFYNNKTDLLNEINTVKNNLEQKLGTLDINEFDYLIGLKTDSEINLNFNFRSILDTLSSEKKFSKFFSYFMKDKEVINALLHISFNKKIEKQIVDLIYSKLEIDISKLEEDFIYLQKKFLILNAVTQKIQLDIRKKVLSYYLLDNTERDLEKIILNILQDALKNNRINLNKIRIVNQKILKNELFYFYEIKNSISAFNSINVYQGLNLKIKSKSYIDDLYTHYFENKTTPEWAETVKISEDEIAKFLALKIRQGENRILNTILNDSELNFFLKIFNTLNDDLKEQFFSAIQDSNNFKFSFIYRQLLSFSNIYKIDHEKILKKIFELRLWNYKSDIKLSIELKIIIEQLNPKIEQKIIDQYFIENFKFFTNIFKESKIINDETKNVLIDYFILEGKFPLKFLKQKVNVTRLLKSYILSKKFNKTVFFEKFSDVPLLEKNLIAIIGEKDMNLIVFNEIKSIDILFENYLRFLENDHLNKNETNLIIVEIIKTILNSKNYSNNSVLELYSNLFKKDLKLATLLLFSTIKFIKNIKNQNSIFFSVSKKLIYNNELLKIINDQDIDLKKLKRNLPKIKELKKIVDFENIEKEKFEYKTSVEFDFIFDILKYYIEIGSLKKNDVIKTDKNLVNFLITNNNNTLLKRQIYLWSGNQNISKIIKLFYDEPIKDLLNLIHDNLFKDFITLVKYLESIQIETYSIKQNFSLNDLEFIQYFFILWYKSDIYCSSYDLAFEFIFNKFLFDKISLTELENKILKNKKSLNQFDLEFKQKALSYYFKTNELLQKEYDEKSEDINLNNGENFITIANAGLIICWPFLFTLFNKIGLIKDKKFKDDISCQKAILITDHLLYKNTKYEENRLVLNKILCGVEPGYVVNTQIEILNEELMLCDNLLSAIIKNWDKLGNTSIDSLRETFLIRNGSIKKEFNDYILNVESKPFDMLLKTIPWNITMIQTVFMKNRLIVEWKY